MQEHHTWSLPCCCCSSSSLFFFFFLLLFFLLLLQCNNLSIHIHILGSLQLQACQFQDLWCPCHFRSSMYFLQPSTGISSWMHAYAVERSPLPPGLKDHTCKKLYLIIRSDEYRSTDRSSLGIQTCHCLVSRTSKPDGKVATPTHGDVPCTSS